MLLYLGRTTAVRVLSIALACTIAWLWVVLRADSTPKSVLDSVPAPPLLSVVAPVCDPAKQTVRVSKLSQSLFPVSDYTKTDSWVGENHKMLRALFRCLELSNCARNQNKIVILNSYHFRGALWGWNGGEDIWARSTIQVLRNMEYTFLYTPNMERAIQLYHMMPDMVKAILVEPPDSHLCFEDDENCILSHRNPDGIPVWKIFSFSFWTHPDHPLGRKWTLSPEEYALEGHPPNTFLGYSVEPSCLSRPFIEQEKRPDQAYIMTKKLTNLAEGHDQAWPPHFFEAASKYTGVEFIMGANDDGPHPKLPNGVKNLGQLSQPQFIDQLSNSLVLIGVGRPLTSPTPYEALCLGVPFINPILEWDRHNPQDKTKWTVQHGMLKLLDPPYVYNVFKNDFDGFIEAIEDAVTHPIERHIIERMRLSSIARRFRAILETDWKSEAAQLLAERQAKGEGPLFTV